MSDFGDVRSLLHEARPTQSTFEAVAQAFKDARDPAEAERVWLPYALERLACWPDALRCVRLEGGEALGDPWWALARGVQLRGVWSEKATRELLGSSRMSSVRVLDASRVQMPNPTLHWEALHDEGAELNPWARRFLDAWLRSRA